MAISLIDVSINNSSLALLRARKYDSAYTPVPNTKLDETLTVNLNVVYNALSGENMPVDSNTFLVKADGGYLQRLFSPIFGKDESGNLIIRWGNVNLPIDLDSDRYTVKAGQFDFSGRGADTALFINVKVGKDVVRMPFGIRQQNWENRISVDDFDYLLSEDMEQLVLLLGVLKEAGAGSTTSGAPLLSLRDLEVDDERTVIAYKPVQTSYGQNFILTFSDGDQCWGHKSINTVLAARPEITEEKPAQLILTEKREFKPGAFAINAILLITAEDDETLVF